MLFIVGLQLVWASFYYFQILEIAIELSVNIARIRKEMLKPVSLRTK